MIFGNMKFIMLSNFDCRKSVDKQSVVDSHTWSVKGENASFDHRVINHFGCVDSVRLTWTHLEWRYFRSCWYVVQCSLLLLYNYYYIIIVFITLFMHDDAHCWVMCIIGRERECVCVYYFRLTIRVTRSLFTLERTYDFGLSILMAAHITHSLNLHNWYFSGVDMVKCGGGEWECGCGSG